MGAFPSTDYRHRLLPCARRPTVIASWRGEEAGVTAASSGHDVVMCPEQYVYLDHRQASLDSAGELCIYTNRNIEVEEI